MLGTIVNLIVGAFIVYPKVQAAQRAEVESLYSSTASYSGLANGNSYRVRIFPVNMYKQSGLGLNIVNTWKVYVTVAYAATGLLGTAGSAFIITYTGVPTVECSKIISAVAGNFYLAQVETTTVKDVESNLDVEVITEACSNGGNSNVLVLTSL